MATFGSNGRIKETCLIGPCGIFLLLVANCEFVATSVTWTAPPPAWTQTDSSVIRTVDMPVLLGSTQVPLRWNYALSSGTVLLTTFVIDGDDIGIIFPSGITTINDRHDYQTRFNISTSEVATLIINKVTEREDATYQCKLTLSGNTWAYNIRVNVTVAAKLTKVSGDQNVHEGSNMLLVCEATGKPTPNITWTRVLGDNSSSEVLHQGPTWNFPNINRTDSGTYRCAAYNGFGNPVSQEVRVNVTYPARIVQLASEYKVAVEQSVSLRCQAEGNPKPTYIWTPCESVCQDSTLNISEVLSDGVYTCTVANGVGSDAQNTSVVIAGTLINVTLTITSESCNDGKYNQSLLWKKLNDTMDVIYANESRYNSTRLTGVRCGIVIVDLELKFNSTVTEREIITILRNAAKNGKLGEFSVNASSIVGTRPEVASTTTAATTTPTSSSDSKKTWIIVGAVLGSVAALLVIGVIAWCVYKKRKCNRKDPKVHNNDPQEGALGNDQEGAYAQANSAYADVGPRPHPSNRTANPSSVPSVTYDAVKQRVETPAKKEKKGVVKEKPVDEYAVVDKSKQKKKVKKPKPGELQYAELGEFQTGQQIPNTSTSSPPDETQYADINLTNFTRKDPQW